MSELCLTLLCPPALEERVLDLLLMSPDSMLFTSTRTAAHGMASSELSQAEQVAGRAHAIQIQLVFSAAAKAALFDQLRQEFAGAGLRYWLTTVVDAGEIA